MRCISRLATLALALTLPSASGGSLLAQPASSTKPIRIVMSGGLTLPQGELKDFHDTGFHADASLLLSFAGFPLTLRPELSLTRLKQSLPSTIFLPSSARADTSQTTQFLGALGNIELPLAGGLYVLGGLGVLNLDAASDSQTKLTINAGAGFRFRIGRAEGFVEARLGTASYDAGAIGYSKAQLIPISFGLAF